MKHTLENHRLFPYIAWATVISFAFFTYTLAKDLQTDLDDLDQSVERVERSLEEMKASRSESAGTASPNAVAE